MRRLFLQFYAPYHRGAPVYGSPPTHTRCARICARHVRKPKTCEFSRTGLLRGISQAKALQETDTLMGNDQVLPPHSPKHLDTIQCSSLQMKFAVRAAGKLWIVSDEQHCRLLL